MELLYGGTEGNVELYHTHEEAELFMGLPQWSEAVAGLRVVSHRAPVNEFGLIWGRRSGKDFFASICALYEAYRVLSKGDPQAYYSLSPGTPIVILIVSFSTDAAGVIKNEIVNMMQKSSLFSKMLIERRARTHGNTISFDTETMSGAVCIKFISAQSESMLGLNVFSLLLLEPACYKHDLAARICEAMCPSMMAFQRHMVSEKMPDHRQIDGKLIVVGTPRGKSGFFWEFYASAPYTRQRLVLKASTWAVNPRYTREALRLSSPTMSEEEFNREYGAEFTSSDEATEQVSLRLRVGLVEKLKKEARRQAFETDKDIGYTDIIRDMLEKRYAA